MTPISSSALLISWILLFSNLTLSSADVFFTIPTTRPFLLKKSKLFLSAATTTDPAIILSTRGGSEDNKSDKKLGEAAAAAADDENNNNNNNDDEDWEDVEEYDDGDADEEEEAVAQDFVVEEEAFVEIESDEIFDEEEEDEEEDEGEEETFHDAVEELPAAEEPAPLTRVLEERMTPTTDDESSAFVDRMDLADAYDEGETTTAGDESAAIAAASAAKVSGGGDDDDDDDGDDKAEEKTVEKSDADATDAVITDKMAAVLKKDLKYTARDVKLMRPDIAAVVLAKGLRRPIEGMPPNFYVDGAGPSKGLRGALVKVTLTIAAVGAVAVLGLNGDLDFIGNPFALIAAIPSKLQSSSGTSSKPKKVAASKTPKKEAEVAKATTTTTTTPTVTSIPLVTPGNDGDVEDESEDVDDGHPHSVKPNAAHAPAFEEDLDKTWLDKAITKVENAIKGFFRIEI